MWVCARAQERMRHGEHVEVRGQISEPGSLFSPWDPEIRLLLLSLHGKRYSQGPTVWVLCPFLISAWTLLHRTEPKYSSSARYVPGRCCGRYPRMQTPHSVHHSLSRFIRWLLCSRALILQSKHESSMERSRLPAEVTSSWKAAAFQETPPNVLPFRSLQASVSSHGHLWLWESFVCVFIFSLSALPSCTRLELSQWENVHTIWGDVSRGYSCPTQGQQLPHTGQKPSSAGWMAWASQHLYWNPWATVWWLLEMGLYLGTCG